MFPHFLNCARKCFAFNAIYTPTWFQRKSLGRKGTQLERVKDETFHCRGFRQRAKSVFSRSPNESSRGEMAEATLSHREGWVTLYILDRKRHTPRNAIYFRLYMRVYEAHVRESSRLVLHTHGGNWREDRVRAFHGGGLKCRRSRNRLSLSVSANIRRHFARNYILMHRCTRDHILMRNTHFEPGEKNYRHIFIITHDSSLFMRYFNSPMRQFYLCDAKYQTV